MNCVCILFEVSGFGQDDLMSCNTGPIVLGQRMGSYRGAAKRCAEKIQTILTSLNLIKLIRDSLTCVIMYTFEYNTGGKLCLNQQLP